MTLEGEVNRFLHRHPNWGAIMFFGGFMTLTVVGGMVIDHVAGHGVEGSVLLLAVLFFGGMALAGNRHFS